MRCFCLNRWFVTHGNIWNIRDLTRIVLAIAKYRINETNWKWNSWKLTEGDSLERVMPIPPCLILIYSLLVQSYELLKKITWSIWPKCDTQCQLLAKSRLRTYSTYCLASFYSLINWIFSINYNTPGTTDSLIQYHCDTITCYTIYP